MTSTPPALAPMPWYKNPGWLSAAIVGLTALFASVGAFAHISGQSADNARQITLLWSRVNDVPKIYADVAAIKAHAEDEEKRLDQIDMKLDRALERDSQRP